MKLRKLTLLVGAMMLFVLNIINAKNIKVGEKTKGEKNFEKIMNTKVYRELEKVGKVIIINK